MVRTFLSAAAAERWRAGREFLGGFPAATEVVVLSGNRGAADDLVRTLAGEGAATFGFHRFSLTQLAFRVAAGVLAGRGLTPITPLASQATAAHVSHAAMSAGKLPYFAPVAMFPGFAPSLSATLQELRLAGVTPDEITSARDLSELLAAYNGEVNENRFSDHSVLFNFATEVLKENPPVLTKSPVLLLDVHVDSKAQMEFLRQIINTSNNVFATLHTADEDTQNFFRSFKGAEILLPAQSPPRTSLERLRANLFAPTSVTAAKYLRTDVKKRFERYATSYTSTLFAQHVLVTEGPSELGFLPVAIKHFSQTPADNPFHFGLELFDGENRDTALVHAITLRELGRKTHVLLDYDVAKVGEKTTHERLSAAIAAGSHATTWADTDPLTVARGCDLEILLVATIDPTILRQAILRAYEDTTHELKAEEWAKARQEILDEQIRNELPTVLNLTAIDNSRYTDEQSRALNLALLHGPHSCKSRRDMRLIAEYLAKHKAIPVVFDVLRKHLLDLMKTNDAPKLRVLLG